MKYEVILFDADETLFDFKKSEREAFRKAMIDMGIEYDEDYHFKIYHEINTKIWREFEEGLITQEKPKVERFRRLANKLSIKLDEYEIAELYMNHLSEASFLYDESIELLEELKEKYKLIIITNGLTKVQDKRIRKSKIAKYFKEIIISEEVDISKPNAEIFHHALDDVDVVGQYGSSTGKSKFACREIDDVHLVGQQMIDFLRLHVLAFGLHASS